MVHNNHVICYAYACIYGLGLLKCCGLFASFPVTKGAAANIAAMYLCHSWILFSNYALHVRRVVHGFRELLLRYLSTIERFTFLICYLFCRFIWVSAFSATQNCSYNWSSFPLHLLTCTLLQLLELPATVTSLHLYLQVYVAIQHQISIKI